METKVATPITPYETHPHSTQAKSELTLTPSRFDSTPCNATPSPSNHDSQPSPPQTYLNQTISTSNLVPALMIQAFATGILDATTYLDFKTFASNQTGNTIVLTVSVLDSEGVLVLLTGVSLASFLVGALIAGHLGHYLGVRRRLWLLLTTFFQFLLLVITLPLLSPLILSTNPSHTHSWAPLSLFAFMSGIQVAQARQSGSAELPTAPMTSSLVDLMADKNLFAGWKGGRESGRNKRAGYVGVMVLGGFLGAGIIRAGEGGGGGGEGWGWGGAGGKGSVGAVGLVAGLKAVVVGYLLWVKGEGEGKGETLGVSSRTGTVCNKV